MLDAVTVNALIEQSTHSDSCLTVEHKEGPYLATLREYIESMGGRLSLIAYVGDRAVELTPPATT